MEQSCLGCKAFLLPLLGVVYQIELAFFYE